MEIIENFHISINILRNLAIFNKTCIFRMSTLHEENSNSRDSDEDDKDSNGKGVEDATIKSATVGGQNDPKPAKIPTSQTCDSLNELQPKLGTGSPSIVSSGYGSQAASSSNLSSEDSLSIKSISVDETPETETNNVVCDVAKVLAQPQSLNLDSLLSPPDVSLQSISPGEDTDHTMTETPSSTNITPSQSMTESLVIRRQNINNKAARTLSQRLSCPSNLLLQNDPTSGSGSIGVNDGIIRSCRRSVPDVNDNNAKGCSYESLNNKDDYFNGDHIPDWLKVGESVQVRPSNLSGVVAFVGSTQFASGIWVGLELDTSQGKNNGTVKGVKYFECPPKKGVFVRAKNVKLDKRGREMHLRRRIKDNETFDRNHRPCSKSKTRTK